MRIPSRSPRWKRDKGGRAGGWHELMIGERLVGVLAGVRLSCELKIEYVEAPMPLPTTRVAGPYRHKTYIRILNLAPLLLSGKRGNHTLPSSLQNIEDITISKNK
mgnify:CR=1 FL=1